MSTKKRKNKGKKEFENRIVFAIALILIAIIAYGVLQDSKNKEVSVKTSEDLVSEIKREEDENIIVVPLEDIEPEEPIDENVVIEVEESKKEEDSTNSSDSTITKATTKNSTSTTSVASDMPYYIKINTRANVVTVYKKDSSGNYTIPVKAMVCSTGTFTPPVAKYPKSKYKTTGGKSRWGHLQGNVYGQYTTQIVGNILFHSVPYTGKDPSSLEYWEYDKLGTSASAGCIRLTVADARWVYNNIARGTIVEFYSDSNPGPLGKPSAQKISSNVECRGWDPTDVTDGNPWKNVKNEEPKAEPAKQENVIQNNITVPEKTNTEKTNMQTNNTDKTNTEKTNTQTNNTNKTNTEKANTQTNNTNKTNTEKANTQTNNTNKTNTEKANTQTNNTNKTNTENTNTQTNNNSSNQNTNTEKNNVVVH